MPQVLRDDRPNRLAKAANKQIKDWEEGYLSRTTLDKQFPN